MSMFGSIMNKIFHHPSAAPASAPAAAAPAAPTEAPVGQAPAAASSSPATPVDVGAVLSEMASTKGGGGHYETSIVDLLKLLDMDSSLDARKILAQEMSVHAGADGSAEQNIALHKAVVQKLAENGGVMPASMAV